MRRKLTALLLAASGIVALGAAASPALAATYTMNLSAPASATVGQPVVIEASGVKPPPDQFWYLSWIVVVAIPKSVVSDCPLGAQDGYGVAAGAGGKIVEIALRPHEDVAGNYYNTTAFTTWAPGPFLICGYMDNEEGQTLVRATPLNLDVQAVATAPAPAPSAPAGPPAGTPAGTPANGPAPTATPGGAPGTVAAGAKPASVGKPQVTRTARALTCNPGRWSNDATTFAYGWLVDGKAKKGAAGRKLGVTRSLRGRKVKCSVTASNAAGGTTAVSPALRVR